MKEKNPECMLEDIDQELSKEIDVRIAHITDA